MVKNLREALADKEFKAEYNKLMPYQKKDVPGFVIMGLIMKKIKKQKEKSNKKGQ